MRNAESFSRLVTGGRDMEAGAVIVRQHHGGPWCVKTDAAWAKPVGLA